MNNLCRPRKRHQCRLCNQWIEVGEPCHRYSGLEPGEGYYTIYLHLECEAFTEKWDEGDWECCWPGHVGRPQVAEAEAKQDARAAVLARYAKEQP